MAVDIPSLWPTMRIIILFIIPLLNTANAEEEEGQQCGRPGRPVNGTVSTSGRFYFPGERVAYKCLEGFVLFGDDERTCQKNGTWSAEVPLCDFNLARGKRTLQSATLWSYAPELAVDGNKDTCSFTPRVPDPRWWQVHLGHKFNVMSVGVTISPGSTQEFTIYVIELLTDNKALYKPCTTFKGVFQTHKAVFQCNDGLGHPGQFVYIRDDRKEQEYFGLCEVEVFAFRERIPCGEPEVPVEGEVERVNESTAKYSCREGYKIEGDSTLTCSSKGKWQGQTPKCKESKCGTPDHLAHGFVEVANHRGVYGYGTKAIYNCSPGYVLQGNATRTCDFNGEWTGGVPTCKAVSCGPPPEFRNAKHTLINGSTHWNGIAVYTCESGYRIHRDTGDTVTTCMGIGAWRFINVTCIPQEVSLASSGGRRDGKSLEIDHTAPIQHNSQGLVIALAIVAGLLTAAMLVVGALLARRHVQSRPGSMRSLVQSSPAGGKENHYKVGPAHSLENSRNTGIDGSNMTNGKIQGVRPSLYQQNLLSNLPRRPQAAADQQSISSNFTSLAGSELDDDPNYARIPGQDPTYERIRNRSEHSYETLRKKSFVSELESEDSGSTKEIGYAGSVGYESVKEGKDKEGYETVKEKSHDYETVKHKDPGYETVKDQEHGYETVCEPSKGGIQHSYETLKPRPPPPRISSSSDIDCEREDAVPDILQNLQNLASCEESSSPSSPSSPVPPEILALYAKVDKSKKRPKSEKFNIGEEFAPSPQGASPTPPQSPLQSMSSTSSSASMSDPQTDVSFISDVTVPQAGTKDLIRKFSSEDSANEETRRPRSRQGSITSDTGTLRPLPPLPREHKHKLPDLPS